MGTYYHFAVVHKRVLVWWTDNEGKEHEQWISGQVADLLMSVSSELDFRMQSLLRHAIEGDGKL